MRETVRFDAATRPQVAAADPRSASWVSANAGSGKTRVLTDRVARLLLDGTPPQRILCLTFTTAAAANMQVRLFERLGEWSMLPGETLKHRLLKLGVQEESLGQATLERARTLFARALETPGGLKIQTIHAFCSSLLKRFPLEAGVSPQFQQIDERSARTLQGSVLDDIALARPKLYGQIARRLSENRLTEFLDAVSAKQQGFQSPPDIRRVLRLFGLGAEPYADGGALDRVSILLIPEYKDHLRTLIAALNSISPTERNRKAAEALTAVLSTRDMDFAIRVLSKWFLTGRTAQEPFMPSLRWPQKAVVEAQNAEFRRWLESYRGSVAAARMDVINAKAAEESLTLHRFAAEFLGRCEQKKRAAAMLDFSDLILKSLRLLRNRDSAQWVLYRLDGGIDHVLVDEAQDVSPSQWEIISEIASEFTAGEGARNRNRTVFAVGDEKQSIYGFQGAAPEMFEAMRDTFRDRYRNAGMSFAENRLLYSFRSSRPILELVDAVFEDCTAPGFQSGVTHRAFHEHQPGRVDLWPFIAAEKADDEEEWDNPAPQRVPPRSHTQLARLIARRVRGMLQSELLPGEDGGRRIGPGDILILVRRRSDLFYAIIQELKALDLPVAGADRLKLIEELAVRDLTAMLSFLAFSRDDLSLAAALRSPLFGLSEDQLFALAHDRGGLSLWESMQAQGNDFLEAVSIIKDLIAYAERSAPYEILERILTHHGGRQKLTARLGHEIEEAIDSYLQQALAHEERESASLTGFLSWLTAETEIKRQLDQGGEEIRVMTIHGAKGLESPIVILPDTEQRTVPSGGDIEAAPEDGTPLLMVNRDESPPVIEEARDAAKARDAEEQFRLLYVALTRAENWLIVCGEGRSNDDCWYTRIARSLSKCGGKVHVFGGAGSAKQGGMRLAYGKWPATVAARTGSAGSAVTVPGWVASRPKPPERPPAPLAPSGLGLVGGESFRPEPGAAGEPAAGEAAKFGTCVHLLLEHLPSVARRGRRAAARSILKLHDRSIDEAFSESAFEAAERLLNDARLSFLFTGESLREVAFTASSPTLRGRQIQGYIDLLLVSRERALAVDFKSNSRIPECPEDIAEGILRQMGAYREALLAVFPDRRIETAILWTRTGALMEVPPEICEEALHRAADGLR